MDLYNEDDEFAFEESPKKLVNLYEIFFENRNGSFELTENVKNLIGGAIGKIKILLLLGKNCLEVAEKIVKFQDKSQQFESLSNKNNFIAPNATFYNEENDETIIFFCKSVFYSLRL